MAVTPTLAQRHRGALLGLLIGDALGVPYEFHPPQVLPPLQAIDFDPPAGFQRSHPIAAPGTWSDDGAQALVLLESLLRVGELDLADFAAGLLRWLQSGYMAIDGDVFDVGGQTLAALRRLEHGCDPMESGGRAERDNGNGALMRVLPLALRIDAPRRLVEAAMLQALPTHAHPRSGIACAMYCLWARALSRGLDSESGWQLAERELRELAGELDLPSRELALVLDPGNAAKVAGSGYVVDTLWSARACLRAADDYAGAVRRAVALGHDTDTTAAVTGGLAGMIFGEDGIPEDWRRRLRGQALLAPLLAALGPDP